MITTTSSANTDWGESITTTSTTVSTGLIWRRSSGTFSPPEDPGFKYGDLICYRTSGTHDDPLMYLGPCLEDGYGLCHILDLTNGTYDHKDPAMWQKCTHIKSA